jgi:hypothetical protein
MPSLAVYTPGARYSLSHPAATNAKLFALHVLKVGAVKHKFVARAALP